ncbi:multidrug ABC transporter ATP-binding protein [Ammoniphilus oxalaticus]|uniref:Multidrug ABC transporter ATP-binding protein n=1 Tax=Ammoniphilus oxalaticus TaxID=66863 RepID=A0A419SGM0_9BACL|nr:ABC transporter ATP-binding protein [Ammoniphilus oxalaticus]RKD22930.1 multidrug ABC transporter ATP-binding protein [Ammoniphilus oxalaticus]
MFNQLRTPFQYKKIINRHDIKNSARTVKGNQQTSNRSKTLARIFSYLLAYKVRLLFALCMVILSVGFSLLGPFLVGRAIDEYIMTKQTVGLLGLLIQLSAVYLVYSISLFLQNYTMIHVAHHAIFRMRADLFNHLHRLRVSYFDHRQHGELMSRVTNDIELVSATLSQSLIQILSSLLTLIGAVAVMLYLSPLLTLVTMITIPIMVLSIRWITRRTRKLFKDQQRVLGELNGFIEETISGQQIVRTFSQEKRVIRQFHEQSADLKGTAFWAQTYTGFIPKVMGFLNHLNFSVIAGVGGILALLGNAVTVGVIVVFAEYARQFTRPLNELANQFNLFLSAIAGAERVFEIMDEKEERDELDAMTIEKMEGKIEFKNVSFSYEKGAQTLVDVSFKASPGQTIALVGPTGAGKTTLIQLLARFYPLERGAILIDGTDITKVKRHSLLQQMGFVLQDAYLFHGTIRDNIRYGNFESSDKDVVEAAKRAFAHEFIMKLPGQYEFMLDQDGGGISQGQRQLLSIARALLSNPSILLLDEATSNIDTVSEIHIQRALQQLMEGRTCFIIAHRLNTIQQADQILVLNHGRIIERGNHQQLQEQQGFYADLFLSQTSEKRV